MNHDVVCQVPPEAGHPPKIAARLTKPAYGVNDAPRRWWSILDKALRGFAACCIRRSRVSDLGNTGDEGPQHSSTVHKMFPLDCANEQKWTLHLKKTLDPMASSPTAGTSIINLFVDDLFLEQVETK